MVRVGWLPDVHQSQENSTLPGPQDRFTHNLNTLGDTYDVADVFCTGDCTHPQDNDRGNVPHITKTDIDTFWRYVDKSRVGDRVHAIPGNHDVPLQTFLASDDRAIWRGRFTYDGVTIIALTTAVPGAVTGSPGHPYDQGGVGVNHAYVSYADLVWLEEQLDAAGDDVKIVFPHHATYFVNAPGLDAYSPDGNYREGNSYDVCLNYASIHSLLASYEKVVVPFSHLYQFESADSYTEDGIIYAWKRHYYEFTADRVHTYAYLDATNTAVQLTTVDQDQRERIIVDVTF